MVQPLGPYTIDDILADGCFLDRATLETMLQRLETEQNIILQAPPGSGKTWLSKKLTYAFIGHKDDDQVRQVQFHTNLSYEDFVRGWRPQAGGKLDLVDGPFLKLAENARNDPDGKYVMVIEEINRGNPASIFGELLTLLEADKRNPDDGLALAYPSSDSERFHIPPNVYVIGTMNLADRSLALVDFALRRRFAFFDLVPALNATWRDWVDRECSIPTVFLSRIAQRVSALNDQIAADPNLGDQFRIGHSHFTPTQGTPIDDHIQWFKDVVETEIAPLLREYWFDSLVRSREETDKLVAGLRRCKPTRLPASLAASRFETSGCYCCTLPNYTRSCLSLGGSTWKMRRRTFRNWSPKSSPTPLIVACAATFPTATSAGKQISIGCEAASTCSEPNGANCSSGPVSPAYSTN